MLMTAKVLVVRTKDLFANGYRKGFTPDSNEKFLKVVERKSFFKKRSEVEEDDRYQQIIPQIVLVVGKRVLIHKIPSTSSERRLHNMWPIFLGGHIDDSDLGIDNATEREFNEEIDYKGAILSRKYIGIIKLGGALVNRVHTGFVYIFRGDIEEFYLRGDRGIGEARFVDLDNLSAWVKKMTYWSKAFYPHLSRFI